MRNYSDSEFKEVHDLLLGLMRAFKNVCEAENIWYTLAYGTLLGAVRHKGFIPWDADADVHIRITDVEAFREAFYKNKPEGIVLIDRGSDPHNTTSHDVLCYERNVGYPGIHLDIDPLVGAPNDIAQQKRVWRKNFNLDKIFRSKYVNVEECLEKNRNKVRIVKFIDKFIPDSVIRANIKKRENEYNLEKSDYWTCLCSAYLPIPKKAWSTISILPFEDDEYKVPGDWDAYLKSQYGDYMKPRKY